MRIILKDEEPVCQPPRRLAFTERQEVNKQIEEWLNEGIIRPSSSEYASPIVMVKKKDGSSRMCIDYRKLNQKLVKDKFPLPLIEDVLDTLQEAKHFRRLCTKKELITCIARWALQLEEFDYEIEHRAGSRMKHVDALSRYPVMIKTWAPESIGTFDGFWKEGSANVMSLGKEIFDISKVQDGVNDDKFGTTRNFQVLIERTILIRNIIAFTE
ncbi:retrovirus-related Pol polyprotein from transposon 412 [Trichonephila clavipes]|nr:retrovirus-related Pol polyprotein from transposon 412 [Trichonephila clavipes]